MKLLRYTLLLLLLPCILYSCKGGNKTDDGSDTIIIKTLDSIPDIVETIGTVGDGTSMNVIEVINEAGDTIYVNAPESVVAGSVSVGDKIDIVYASASGENVITMAVNLTSLAHLWSQRAADGHEQSLELNINGTASTYGMNVDYERWSISDGLLLLQSPRRIGSEAPAPVDTFDILALDDENLVLGHGNVESIFERSN